MRFPNLHTLLFTFLSLHCNLVHVDALFEEDAGEADFTLSTSGIHPNGIGYARLTSDQTSIITTSFYDDDDADDTSVANSSIKGQCYISARNVVNGTLVWRRDVCAGTGTKTHQHAILHEPNMNQDDIYANHIYTVDNSGVVRAWDETDGSLLMETSILSSESSDLDSDMDFASPQLYDYGGCTGVEDVDTCLGVILSSKTKGSSSKDSVVTLLYKKDLTVAGVSISAKQLVAKAGTVTSNIVTNDGQLECGTTSATVSDTTNGISITTAKATKVLSGVLQKAFLLSCSNKNDNDIGEMKAILTTTSGTTYAIQINAQTQEIVEMWTVEEALGSVSSAIFLDAAQPIVMDENSNDGDEDDDTAILASLSFQARLSSQVKSITDFFTNPFNALLQGSSNSLQTKQYSFGIAKVAVLLSNPFSKVMGMDTSSGGSTLWTMDLNPQASWHKIIHGSSSGHSSVFGHGHHHPHSHEILMLSQTEDYGYEWFCVDGLRGRVFSKATVEASSPIVQIIPVHHGLSHGEDSCRQNAILVHEDDSVSIVPDTVQTRAELGKVLADGIYTHKVEKETGIFQSMHIDVDSGSVITVGETLFDPASEKIINVAYPERNEVIQSPITMLGDDSLLLKYLNPHLCVIVTEATPELLSDMNESDLYKALESSAKTDKKKPVGATKPGESAAATEEKRNPPSLFINVMDTVSGQILYRTSHIHASVDDIAALGTTNVPVVISENWVIYALPNYKTRRTELGVMTLYEGMIDKHGISAFNTPEQQSTFSSMTSQKPIVLTKTYGFIKPVTALGVTNTKNGISSKSLLLATGSSGQIVRIDRRFLDTRRPSGEPTKSEKKEGLMQYAPLLPISPLFTPSYTNHIVDATSIISTSANLESQTLILAFGGPDIFFARFAPSKGFDILPESFNKPLLMLVVSGFVIVLNLFRSKSQSKFVKLGWS